jgi:mono/diheme cytochrome c family protein
MRLKIGRTTRWSACLAGALSAASLVLPSLPRAQPTLPPPPSAEQGHLLAQRLCAGCHLTEGGSANGLPAGVPSLRAIANRAGQSSERIAQALIQPHAPMPDMQITRREIDDILAYLQTLRADPTAPPLIAPPGGGKPRMPAPS